MVRRVLWVLLCLIAGGPCAFLALEGIGLPIVAIVLVALIVIGRRTNSLAETLLGFGLTYAVEVFRVATADLALAAQRPDLGAVAYFAAHLAVAAAIVLSGFWMLLKRPQPAHPRGGGGSPDPSEVAAK
jgi:hypothetical protein